VAVLHQRPRTLRQRGKAVRADVVSCRECGAGESVQEVAGQRFARREGDRMQQAVERAPFAFERVE